jgi:hypothetical protein
MSVTRSALLTDLRDFRRDVNARLDALERKLLERPVPSGSQSRPASTARVSFPPRRTPPRRSPARARDLLQNSSSPHAGRWDALPTATKVACDACREVCWENCAYSCHHVRRVAAR